MLKIISSMKDSSVPQTLLMICFKDSARISIVLSFRFGNGINTILNMQAMSANSIELPFMSFLIKKQSFHTSSSVFIEASDL